MSAIYYRLIGYVVTLALHSFTFYDIVARLQVTTKDPVVARFATLQANFLTIWNFLAQITYVTIGLYCDVTTIIRTRNKPLNCFRETFFASIIWPVSWMVALLFWPMYLYDTTLVFPTFVDKILSDANNVEIHAFIVLFVVWELVFLPRFQRNHARNVLLTAGFMCCYLYVFFRHYLQTGRWLYPFFKLILGSIYFPLYFVFVVFLLIFVYCVQWPLTNLVWKENTLKKVQ